MAETRDIKLRKPSPDHAEKDFEAFMQMEQRLSDAIGLPIEMNEYMIQNLRNEFDCSLHPRNATKILFAEMEDSISGHSYYRIGRNLSNIWSMYVLPEHQGKGAGKQMLSYVITEARALNSRKIHLMSANGSNNFYKQFGFVVSGNLENELDLVL